MTTIKDSGMISDVWQIVLGHLNESDKKECADEIVAMLVDAHGMEPSDIAAAFNTPTINSAIHRWGNVGQHSFNDAIIDEDYLAEDDDEYYSDEDYLAEDDDEYDR